MILEKRENIRKKKECYGNINNMIELKIKIILKKFDIDRMNGM